MLSIETASGYRQLARTATRNAHPATRNPHPGTIISISITDYESVLFYLKKRVRKGVQSEIHQSFSRFRYYFTAINDISGF